MVLLSYLIITVPYCYILHDWSRNIKVLVCDCIVTVCFISLNLGCPKLRAGSRDLFLALSHFPRLQQLHGPAWTIMKQKAQFLIQMLSLKVYVCIYIYIHNLKVYINPKP